jgi:hypothetical protein
MTGMPGGTGALAADLQRSLRRERLQAERRLLERERRGALARLGARTAELMADGGLSAAELAGDLTTVEQARRRIEEKAREIEALGEPPRGAGGVVDPTPARAGRAAASALSGLAE